MKRFFLLLSALLAIGASACTNFLVGKKASKDGATYVTYSADSYGMYGNL
ncbi:MAG: C69 family dipeptidase, partial [Bacteroidaceae bacterium]|nr:C69 family dipeptidase [Bacteroidaceae bacterium]